MAVILAAMAVSQVCVGTGGWKVFFMVYGPLVDDRVAVHTLCTKCKHCVPGQQAENANPALFIFPQAVLAIPGVGGGQFGRAIFAVPGVLVVAGAIIDEFETISDAFGEIA
ncbi:MAG: hypothetical protein ACK5HY_03340, partial [Parahaliea sp.]